MTKKIYISLFLNFPLSSFFLIIENLEPNLLFVELFEFLPLKKPEVLFIKVFLLLTSLVFALYSLITNFLLFVLLKFFILLCIIIHSSFLTFITFCCTFIIDEYKF